LATASASIAPIKWSIFDCTSFPPSKSKPLLKDFTMSALYAMSFVGLGGTGGGAVYVGKGKIVGIDVGNLRYSGTYTEQNGRLKGTVDLYAPTGGTLVTDARVPAGSRWNIALDWPVNFSDGRPQALTVQGRSVHVVFEKIDDV
jgi:hypothetical protein